MVAQEWKEKLEEMIKRYGLASRETYEMSMRVAFELEYQYKRKKTIQSYYNSSMEALIKYMKENKINPSENRWDHYAIQGNYLSSKTMGYINGEGFNTLCRKIRKQINR